MNKKEPKFVDQLTHLFILSMEDEINEEQFLKLTQILKVNGVAREYYYDFIASYVGLDQLSILSETDDDQENLFSKEIWEELLEHEQTAPMIEIPKEKAHQELVQKLVYPQKEKHKLSTFSKVFLVMNAAAIVFFFLFLKLVPPKVGIEVATLADSINAKWADVSISMEKGTRLYNDKTPLLLREGLVEIKFDNNAQVTIEGPAEFQILDDDMMKLNYGQLYSQVPPEAYGFQISTQHAKIIDLGTEFGIKENIDGGTQVHVIKGRVNLVSGILSTKINIDLLAGSARELNVATGELKEIPCEDKTFVRQIDSNTNVIWKGQDTVPLTNLLAGTLFDEVRGGIEINPATGEYVFHEDYVSGLERQGGTDYQKMDSPFVDGTFIPSGPQQQTISSTNLTWQSLKTSGSFFYNLSDRETMYDPYTGFYYPLSLTPDDLEKTSLLFHPNMGLTLDLNKIRQKIPTFDICRFRTDCGVSYVMKEVLEKIRLDGDSSSQEEPTMDFTILLDGKVCKTLTGINPDSGTIRIDVEIHPTDRFLTLVSTDGDLSYEFDWFILSDPVLVLK